MECVFLPDTYAPTNEPVRPGDMVRLQITPAPGVIDPYTCRRDPYIVWYPIRPADDISLMLPGAEILQAVDEPLTAVSNRLLGAEETEQRRDFRNNLYTILSICRRKHSGFGSPFESNPNEIHPYHVMASSTKISFDWANDILSKALVIMTERRREGKPELSAIELVKDTVSAMLQVKDHIGRTPLDYAKAFQNDYFRRFVERVMNPDQAITWDSRIPKFWITAPKVRTAIGQAIREPWAHLGIQTGYETWQVSLPLKKGCDFLTRFLRRNGWDLPRTMSVGQLERTLSLAVLQPSSATHQFKRILKNKLTSTWSYYQFYYTIGNFLCQMTVMIQPDKNRISVMFHGVGCPHAQGVIRAACNLDL